MGKVLSDRTASKLLTLLNAHEQGGATRRSSAPRWGLARCESATAVGGSDVLDECYPALLLRPDPATVAEDSEEVGGGVLLTVLGANAESTVPEAGRVYPVMIVGEVRGDRDGDVAGRHRVFSIEFASGSAAGTAGALSSCAWAAGLADTDCLRMTVVSATGKCSEIDQGQDITLPWDGGSSRWESAADAFVGTGSGGSGTVVFGVASGAPYATIDGVSGTPLGCDGGGGLLFAFGGPILCGGASADCDNAFVVAFSCSCCDPLDGWVGPGWYCTVGAGQDCGVDEASVVELLEGDRCGAAVVICSGPYPTEADAVAACGDDLPAPGTSCEDAGPMAPGGSKSDTVAAAEEHWYQFSPAIGVSYTVAVAGAGAGTVDTQTYSSPCPDPIVFGMGFSDNGSFTFIGSGGPIWIRVLGVAGGAYTLSITSP